MFGRVRIYNAGFAVFTAASVLLSFDPFTGTHGALWLIGWRFLQAIGGSMLTANSAAILTDAFPAEQRGFALGTNQVAGLAGMFIGLVAGGMLAAIDWRLVFWVNVPVGIFGTVWAYPKLRETGQRQRGAIDWWGNVTFAIGPRARSWSPSTYGIQPYGGHTMGWTDPSVIAGLVGGIVLLFAFVVIEARVDDPMFDLSLFRSGRSPPATSRLRGVDRPRRAAVHAHHLAAGDLAAAPRLQLRRHAALGGHLHAPADRRLPGRGSESGIAVGPDRRAWPRDRRHGRVRRRASSA